MTKTLITEAQNTWCPGCGNFAIQHALKEVILSSSEGEDLSSYVLVTGIGCHAKMADYLDINSFYSLHGRAVAVACGIKNANPDLSVICCVGDGDCYAEGLDHLIFAAKRNTDITVIVHDNRVYGLTTGQYTPTSPLGYRGRSTPEGTDEAPLNPPDLVLAAGGGFVARGYSRHLPQMKELIRSAIGYRGFAFIDILQICASYFNRLDYYDKFVSPLPPEYDSSDLDNARITAREWDYDSDSPIPTGIIFMNERSVSPGSFPHSQNTERRREVVNDLISGRV